MSLASVTYPTFTMAGLRAGHPASARLRAEESACRYSKEESSLADARGWVAGPSPAMVRRGSWPANLNHPASNLVRFDRLEQRLEIAFAEPFIALALDDLEEDRADGILGEYLQQQSLIFRRRAVHQDAVALQPRHVFAVAFHPIVHPLVIGVGRILKRDAPGAQRFDRVVDVVGAESDVLNAFAAIGMQIFGDLRFVVGGFVDGNADFAAGACHGFGLEAGHLAFDVEIADFAEIEEPFIVTRPLIHVAAKHIVRDVIDFG